MRVIAEDNTYERLQDPVPISLFHQPLDQTRKDEENTMTMIAHIGPIKLPFPDTRVTPGLS